MQVGRMRAVGSAFQKIRGTTVVISVSPEATAAVILQLAVDKHCACDSSLSRSTGYKLLYPDATLVQYIPGTVEEFTLAAYKAFIGKAYSKLILYICSEDEYLPCKLLLTFKTLTV